MARKKSRPPRPAAAAAAAILPPAAAHGTNGSATDDTNGHASSSSEAIRVATATAGPGLDEALQPGNGRPVINSSAITTEKRDAVTAARKEPEPGWAILWRKSSRILGSLQLAVILLTLFALVVLLGTLMEHWYSTEISQELVYRSWWFNFLLFFLAVNIFFAAAKKMKLNTEPLQLQPVTATTLGGKVKGYWQQLQTVVAHFWPWKRHQFGFVVTHIGLITMLTGGVLNSWFGTDASVSLIDSEDRQVHEEVGFGLNQTDRAIYSNIAEIKVIEGEATPHGFRPAAGKSIAADYWGGPFPWRTHPSKTPAKSDMLLSVMSFLRNPLGNGWSLNLDNAQLEIVDFIPLAKELPFAKAEQGEPALLVQFRTDKFVDAPERWFSFGLGKGELEYRRSTMGPAVIEVLGTCPAGLADEFINPPTDLGKKGVLSIRVGNKTHRLKVESNWKEKKALGDSGWSVQINQYVNDPEGGAEDKLRMIQKVLGPSLEVQVWGPKGVHQDLVLLARRPDKIWDRDAEDWAEPNAKGQPRFLFHAPYADLSPPHKGGDQDSKQSTSYGGPAGKQAPPMLQFLAGPGGELYYRSLTHRDKDSKDVSVEESGEVDLSGEKEYPVWHKMGWRFRIAEYLPQARPVDNYTPVDIRPGKETNREKNAYPSAVLCRLSTNEGKSEFWVRKDSEGQYVTVGKRAFRVQYTNKIQPLSFTIKLERAVTTKDPGTGSAATYSSYVQIFDPKAGINGEHRLITMNAPLEHKGFTFYQSSLDSSEVTEPNGRMVSFSGLTVNRDPGITLKYAGSIMLALGIAIMFYMKAYFFKPRRRPTTETPTA